MPKKKKLYCCSGTGPSPSPSPRPTSKPTPLHVPVAKAIAKLFPTARPCEGAREFICLALRDGRQVHIGPGGTFRVLKSQNDKSAVSARKAISAVMLLKDWSFEEAVAWMNKQFGPALTRNSAAEYFDILIEKRRGG
jgi:hypothetical protein